MAADLLALERLCRDLPGQIDQAANKLAKKSAQTIDDDLVPHTPVDTTEAVSNWQAGLNVAPDFPLPPIYPGEQGSTAPQSRAAALAHVQRVIADKQPGERVYITNVAPHIGELNNGTSAQEPAGFVERAIRKGEIFAQATGLEFAK